jgi:Leucine-rich repeat (LRR) protein
MGSPLRLDISCKYVSKLLLLLALLSSALAARPWIVKFGGCVFSGDRDGAALERSGYCPTASGLLDLSYKGITSVKMDSFAGLNGCTSLTLGGNAISVLPSGIFDQGLTELSYLYLHDNAISVLPAGIFDRLGYGLGGKLTDLWLHGNAISVLPEGIFDQLAVGDDDWCGFGCGPRKTIGQLTLHNCLWSDCSGRCCPECAQNIYCDGCKYEYAPCGVRDNGTTGR